jgi:hypothetical protein
MTISTFDQYIAATKQVAPFTKTAARTTIALIPTDIIDLAGNPGAGVLAGTTAAGVVVTSGTAGLPIIGNTGADAYYLTKVTAASSVISTLRVYDLLVKAGPLPSAATTTLNNLLSFTGRSPNAGNGLEAWVEVATAGTGNLSANLTYTNSLGVAGKTTGVIATGLATTTIGQMARLPLAAGDHGINAIQSITTSVSATATYNLLILRPLWTGRIQTANSVIVDNLANVGMPLIYSNSALFVTSTPDATSTGTIAMTLEVSS